MLAVDAAWLEAELGAPALELGVLADVWDLHVHRGAHARAAVGRAAVDVAEVLVVGKLAASSVDLLLNRSNTAGKALKHLQVREDKGRYGKRWEGRRVWGESSTQNKS